MYPKAAPTGMAMLNTDSTRPRWEREKASDNRAGATDT